MKFKYILFLLSSFIISIASYSQKKHQISSTPSWVNQIKLEEIDTVDYEGSSTYLIADFQDNLIEKVRYRHFAIKVLNSEGIQEMSDLSVDYDPSYQNLTLHEVVVIRKGKKIDKLSNSKIQTVNVETDAERLIYNGDLSTIIHLTDVRKNDIIEYSYSLKGFNPIYRGKYSSTFYHQYTFPVKSIFNRVISEKALNYKLFYHSEEPIVLRNEKAIEYVWNINASNHFIYDNNVPAWYDPQKRVSLSSYKNWGEVAKWAQGLYSYRDVNCSKLIPNLDSLSDSQKISAIIKFVQDEIRYLGFENGINAYKPHSSKLVLRNRYGDCKDKSQLLVSMLRSEGVEAYPLLVNSSEKNELINKLPSPNSFDHCVVHYMYDGKEFYVDPTINNQGGNIYNIYFPDYSLGLVINDSTNDLIEIPHNYKNVIDITEDFVLDSINGSASYKVITRYEGKSADFHRSNFYTTTKENIKKDYLNFYTNLYSNIVALETPKVVSNDRLESNEFVIEESYLIKDFWKSTEDSTLIYCEIEPLVLESILNSPNTSNRTMPYYIGGKVSYFQITNVKLPEEWDLQKIDLTISGSNFNYHNNISHNSNLVKIVNNYKRTQEYVEAKDTQAYIDNHDKINSELPYNFTYNSQALNASNKVSYMSIFIGLIALIIGGILVVKLNKTYDPIPSLKNFASQTIGGWLVLPAIGLCLFPLIVFFQMYSNDYFNEIIWIGADVLENSFQIKLLLIFELVMNTLMIVYSSFLIFLFFKKRTSFPRLISLLYLANISLLILDTIISSQIMPVELLGDNSESYKEITKGVITACIWIPYFNISSRVKNTFVNRYGDKVELSHDMATERLEDG